MWEINPCEFVIENDIEIIKGIIDILCKYHLTLDQIKAIFDDIQDIISKNQIIHQEDYHFS